VTKDDSRIDRAALERIVRRAAELQTGERDIGEGLSPDEVVSLGREVGIPARYLQQAMLEERTRNEPVSATGLLDRVVGPATCEAQRVVRGATEDVERQLLAWIEEHELFAVQRQQPGWITWEAMGGMQVALRKSAAALGSARRPFMLSRASTLSATVTALEPGYCHVSLKAELRQARGAVVGGLAGLGSAALAATVILSVMTPFWWVAVAPLPVFLAGGVGVIRTYPPIVARVRLGLERALDNLEHGTMRSSQALPPPGGGILGAVLQEVRKALKPS
jgi:hypothetical protein